MRIEQIEAFGEEFGAELEQVNSREYKVNKTGMTSDYGRFLTSLLAFEIDFYVHQGNLFIEINDLEKFAVELWGELGIELLYYTME